jgi:CRISPR system Cascade subunit CasB
MTTTQHTPCNRLEHEIRFLQSVSDRVNRDNGAKADFKRALSGEPEHVLRVYPFVLPYVGKLSDFESEQQRQEKQIWIPVACLSVYYPQPIQKTEKPRNFGHSCRSLATATNSEGADRRFRALLDLVLSDIQSPLAALVRQMKSKDIAINYAQLLADLRQWEHPKQYIQDRWARAFWGVPSSSSAETESVSDETAE